MATVAVVVVVGVLAVLSVVPMLAVMVVVGGLVTLTTEVIVVVVVVLAMATDEEEDTTVQVSSMNWQRLSGRKTPGDSFDDVIGRLLDETSETSAELPANPGVSDPEQDQEQNVDELIDGLDLPGTSEETVEARRDAVRACYEYLRDRGEARKSSFVDDVYPDNKARYDSQNGWWNTVGKQGLRVIADELPEVEPPAEGEHLWLFREGAR